MSSQSQFNHSYEQGSSRAPGARAVAQRRIDREEEVLRLEQLADWLDSRFRIPGTDIRFGLDAILGLVPGLGDGVLALPSAYIVLTAHRMGVSRFALARMGLNVGIDMLLGAIPLVGDLFDIGFKANRKNVALLRQHLAARSESGMHFPSVS